MRIFVIKAADENTFKELGNYLRVLGKERPGKDYAVTVKENRPIRSLDANAFYWFVINIYAIHTGHTRKEIENMFKMDRHWEEVTYPKTGRRQRVPKDTHDLDDRDFSIVCNNLLQWGREEFPQVIVPRKEDATYAQWIEVKNDYDKTFSGF